jgi:hypothetical protein
MPASSSGPARWRPASRRCRRRSPAERSSSGDHRRDRGAVGLTGADPNRLLERDDEDLAAADVEVRAPSQIASIVGWTNESETAISNRTFSERPTCTVVPR